MRYLLDTNILSDLIRNPDGRVRMMIERVGEEQVRTSIIVAAELRFGAVKADSPQLTTKVDQALEQIGVLPLRPPTDIMYAQIRSRLEARGQPIGNNDFLIASQAMALGLTVVTDNVREFSRVDSLQVENWLRDVESS